MAIELTFDAMPEQETSNGKRGKVATNWAVELAPVRDAASEREQPEMGWLLGSLLYPVKNVHDTLAAAKNRASSRVVTIRKSLARFAPEQEWTFKVRTVSGAQVPTVGIWARYDGELTGDALAAKLADLSDPERGTFGEVDVTGSEVASV